MLPIPCSLSHSFFTTVLTPPWLVGAFAWTNGCCRVSGDGPVFSLSCGGGCACGGCAAEGFFAYEGYRLPARGGSCPCNGSGAVVPGEIGGEEPGLLPGASARFSKRVILFEDEYEDAPGVAVPWRSTEAEAEFAVGGGPNGASYRLELRDGGRLVRTGGSYLPREGTLGPGETFRVKVRYGVRSASGAAGDVVARATVTEEGGEGPVVSEATLTAVRVEVAPVVLREGFPNRHRMGVRERFAVEL